VALREHTRCKALVGKPEGNRPFENLGANGRIILKEILRTTVCVCVCVCVCVRARAYVCMYVPLRTTVKIHWLYFQPLRSNGGFNVHVRKSRLEY